MKKLFIFKIHEECSYRDGIIIVVAPSFEEAKQLVLNLTDEEAFGISYGDNNEKFISGDSTISQFKIDHPKDRYSDYWYLAGTYELKNTSIKSGVEHVAYHGG